MPELPEVETIKNDLRALVLGRRIVGVRLLDATLLRHSDPAAFTAGLLGQEIVGADRRAKYLLIRLSSGSFLVLQLVITGQFLLLPGGAPIRKSTRLVLDLDDGRLLRLDDSNGMGRAHLLTAAELDEKLHLNELGPEAIAEDLTLEEFAGRLRRRRGQIKPMLLDQHFVAGLGNIYVDEVLFSAQLHPSRDARSLSPQEVARLYETIRSILRRGIAARGTTIATYRDVLGRKGHFQEQLQVFLRQGKPCPGCSGVVARITVGGRQTFYCPSCQTLEGAPAEVGPAEEIERPAAQVEEDAS